jgi:3',5'-nucleoside bisphosphate phosphatase
MRFDLHAHTTASDGALTPVELVRLAREQGLDGLAITDHDTVKGVEPAMTEGAELGLEVIPGIELSIQHEGADLHVLGYFIKHHSDTLAGVLAELHQMRVERIRETVHLIRGLGHWIEFEQIMAETGGGAPGRPHIAKAMVKQGIVGSMEEAFEGYIGDGGVAFVPKSQMGIERGMALLLSFGAAPVLAHPVTVDYESVIPSLVELGLVGLEVNHPKQIPILRQRLNELCRTTGLVATGGSDFHFHGMKSRALGAEGVSGQGLQALRDRAGNG